MLERPGPVLHAEASGPAAPFITWPRQEPVHTHPLMGRGSATRQARRTRLDTVIRAVSSRDIPRGGAVIPRLTLTVGIY